LNSAKKVVLVSGSTRGIGKVIADRLLCDNYLVIQNSRDAQFDLDLASGNYIKADVTNFNECKEMIDRINQNFGKLDVLVSNVGSGKKLPSSLDVPNRWNSYINSNLLSTTYLVESALPLLIKSKGNVVAISSISGSSQIDDAPIEYSVSKAALNMYIKSMAHRYGALNVRFNAVAPGNVLFEGSVWQDKLQHQKDTVEEYIGQNVPMKVFITPKDVAEAVAFLAGENAIHTTGVILNVDAGQDL
jgi:3-oxoacyl-[acyl-carrier protein] reductase